MQIPIITGIYSNSTEFRTAYPRNMIPVVKDLGVSKGYLRLADGIVETGVGPGLSRGGIRWNDKCYRVMGQTLCSIDSKGICTKHGTILGDDDVRFDYSFDRLAIQCSEHLYYFNGSGLTEVTSSLLGNIIDFVWVDGYFLFTDGTSLVVTELNNPYSISPFKYGSSEADPDNIIAILKLRNEIYALNRYTIEVFQNVGGNIFPFQRVAGAFIQRGCIGTRACAVFQENLAWMGSGKNEATSIYVGNNGQSAKIATREIDQLLSTYSDAQLSKTKMEVRIVDSQELLYVRLPDRTLVYDHSAAKFVSEPVWFELGSGLTGSSQYRAKDFVYCYNEWLCADTISPRYGKLTNETGNHWSEMVGWEFSTQILYNECHGAIIHSLELVAMTGSTACGTDPQISTSYSLDGKQWSRPQFRSVGRIGEPLKRLNWLRQGQFRHMRIQKFVGTSDSRIVVARLEALVEPLYV